MGLLKVPVTWTWTRAGFTALMKLSMTGIPFRYCGPTVVKASSSCLSGWVMRPVPARVTAEPWRWMASKTVLGHLGCGLIERLG